MNDDRVHPAHALKFYKKLRDFGNEKNRNPYENMTVKVGIPVNGSNISGPGEGAEVHIFEIENTLICNIFPPLFPVHCLIFVQVIVIVYFYLIFEETYSWLSYFGNDYCIHIFSEDRFEHMYTPCRSCF